MEDEKNTLKACIALCIIDDKFHENEKRYLEDICEDEFELSINEIENIHNEIKDKEINQLKKIFNEFTEYERFIALLLIFGTIYNKENLKN